MNAREVLRAAVPPRRRFAAALALGVLANVSAVALLGTSMWLIVRASEQPPILFLSFAVVGVRAFALGRAFFRYTERLAGHDAVFRQLPELRVRLFDRLAELAPWGISGARRGDTLSRFVRDVDELQFYPLRVLLPLGSSLSVALLAAALTGLLSPLAAVGTVSLLAAGGLVATAIARRSAADAARLLAPARGVLADRVLDAVGSWDVLVAFGRAEAAAAAVHAAGAELSRIERRLAVRGGLATAVLVLSGGAAIAVAALALAPLVVAGELPAPAAAVALLLPIALVDLLGVIPAAVHARAAARGAAERIAELLPAATPAGLPDEAAERAAAKRTLGSRPRLELRGLGARYPGADRPSLEGLDLDLAPGELVLLTGPSGAGKSTVAQVAVRLLDYTGSARLDGVELRELGADAVRRRVVLCEQSPWLFHASIRGNLQFARPGASDAELRAALERVGLGDWLEHRGGLDAEVGERGELISGGQAQRLALARALLSEAPILICDEPTANVDPALAERLLRDIAGLSPERSVLLITHQELPVGLAARRVRLAEGKVTTG